MTDLAFLAQRFTELFGKQPMFYRAPGRVNLIGEHTDYNAGFVMPAAIQFCTTVGVAPREDSELRVHSTNFGESVQRQIAAAARPAEQAPHWADYISGVALALRAHGVPLRGADLLVHGEVPLGSGLSSSAALEVSIALALTSLTGQVLEPLTLAQICQRAENEYVGNRCGIMDQFAAACGRAGHALWLDCRSLDFEPVPLVKHMGNVRLIICNTMVRHQLAGSEYNRRREECEEGVSVLCDFAPEVRALRDVPVELLEQHRDRLAPQVYRRCRHIVTENARVCAAAAALKGGDLPEFGRLMRASHTSLRDDYQVSCDELDLMVRLAEDLPGVYGARMTGGGFGGCTVNLVEAAGVAEFSSRIASAYQRATGHTPEVYVCEAADGAAAVPLQ